MGAPKLSDFLPQTDDASEDMLGLAQHPESDAIILKKIFHACQKSPNDEQNIKILREIVSRPDCPKGILIELATLKTDLSIRMIVAARNDLPGYALITLSRDRNKLVRRVLSKNRSCNAEILLRLAGDRDKLVKNAARNAYIRYMQKLKKTNEAQQSQSNVLDEKTRVALAENSHTIRQLKILSRDPSSLVRLAVARNTNATLPFLRKYFALEADEVVRRVVQERLESERDFHSSEYIYGDDT